MSNRLYTGYIDEDQCMGDTLGPKLGGVAGTINQNFYNLDVRVQSLTGASNTQNAQIQSLINQDVNINTRVASISSQILPTTLFVPANYSSQSNSMPITSYWAAAGNTVATPWWSGEQTITLTDPPANAVAALLLFYGNANTNQNNGQRVFVYKASEATAVGRPSNSTTPQNGVNTGALNNNFAKLYLDPTGGPGEWEAEHTSTFPVYFDLATKQIKWFWVDFRNIATPTGNPAYNLSITVLGYYVRFT